MLRPLPLAITIFARNPSEPWLVLSCEHMAGTRHYSAPEQVEHLELDLAEFQERPPSQPLECVGGGGGAVEPEEQEQPSIGVVERARWIGSALPSRRRGARRAGVRREKNTQLTSSRILGASAEGTKSRVQVVYGQGGPRISITAPCVRET